MARKATGRPPGKPRSVTTNKLLVKAGIAPADTSEVREALQRLEAEATRRMQITMPVFSPDDSPTERVETTLASIVDAFAPGAVGALQLQLKTDVNAFLKNYTTLVEYVVAKKARTEQKISIEDKRSFVAVEHREEPPIDMEKTLSGVFEKAQMPEAEATEPRSG